MLLLMVQLASAALSTDYPGAAQRPWALGLSSGAGLRVLPPPRVPSGVAPRIDLLQLEIRRTLAPIDLAIPPQRLDLQLNAVRLATTWTGTTSAKLPISAYATWLRPFGPRHSVAMSPGMVFSVGRDLVVVGQDLRRRPNAGAAIAGKVGLEKSRWLWPAATSGLYLQAQIGTQLSLDPNHRFIERELSATLQYTAMFGFPPPPREGR